MISRSVKICFCLKMASPWSEFRINFNQNSTRSFQGALVGFNNLWIHFIFSLIVCPCLKYLVCRSKWWVKLGVWEVVFFPVPEEIVYSFFNFLFDIFWKSIKLVYVSSLEKSIWFTVTFLPLRGSLTLFQIWFFFLLYLHLFCPI